MFKQFWTTRKRWDKKGVPNLLGMPGPLIKSFPGFKILPHQLGAAQGWKKGGTFMELPFITKSWRWHIHVLTSGFTIKKKPWDRFFSAEMRFWGSRLWTESRQWVGNLSTSTRYSCCIRSEMVGVNKYWRNLCRQTGNKKHLLRYSKDLWGLGRWVLFFVSSCSDSDVVSFTSS